MQNRIEASRLKRFSVLFVIMTCLILSLSSTCRLLTVIAQTGTTVAIDPNYAALNVGDNLTITVTLANAADLFGWQVALKFNGSVINFTDAWIPDDNVFASAADQSITTPTVFGTDTRDGLQYVYIGSQLLTLNPIDVTKGNLLKANFTALADGHTALLITTKSNPVHFSEVDWDRYYTSLLDFSLTELSFNAESGTVVSGEARASPVALFSIIPSPVENTSRYVINGHVPVGGVPFTQTYQGYENLFNASASYDPSPGNTIAIYVWNFGDGNVTQTSNPTVTHTYFGTGMFTVTLNVIDDGNPALESTSVSSVVVVGMVLDYFNWTPFLYVLLAIAVIVIGVVAVRSIRKYLARSKASSTML